MTKKESSLRPSEFAATKLAGAMPLLAKVGGALRRSTVGYDVQVDDYNVGNDIDDGTFSIQA